MVVTYETNDDLAATSFQVKFAELVGEVAGTDLYQGTILGGSTELNAHHEALTSTSTVMVAMRDSTSVRAAFGGINNPAVVKAIRRVMQRSGRRRTRPATENGLLMIGL